LEHLEATLTSRSTKEPCTCGTEIEEAQVTDHGERETERDGERIIRRYKTFTFTRTGRLGYCNWKENESVTIWDDGDYEDVTRIRCEHGHLFGCRFNVEMDYKGADGHIFTTTSWSEGLGGTEETTIRSRGWREAIRDSFNGITTMNRHRHCES
jgi:hypothetical protein